MNSGSSLLTLISSLDSALLAWKMALRPRRLPTLTLFTSGPLCSLCDVAKADLAAVQKQHPFHLKLYDIRRKQGDDPQEYERTAWRRLYQVRPPHSLSSRGLKPRADRHPATEQYDVPVLHYGASEEDSLDSLAGRIKGKKGGRVMKHRIDKDKLAQLVEDWTRELNSNGCDDKDDQSLE